MLCGPRFVFERSGIVKIRMAAATVVVVFNVIHDSPADARTIRERFESEHFFFEGGKEAFGDSIIPALAAAAHAGHQAKVVQGRLVGLTGVAAMAIAMVHHPRGGLSLPCCHLQGSERQGRVDAVGSAHPSTRREKRSMRTAR